MFLKDEKNDHSVFQSGRLGEGLWKNIFKKNPSSEDRIDALLRGVPLFEDMRSSELSEFKEILHRRRFKAREPIFNESGPGLGMYVIQEGTVGIYQLDSNLNQEQIARLSSGDFFGEFSLLSEQPRSATAVALVDTTILGLFNPDLLSLIDRQPRLGNKFLIRLASLLGERLRHTISQHSSHSEEDGSRMIT